MIPRSSIPRRAKSCTPGFVPAPRSRLPSRRRGASTATTSCGRRCGRSRAVAGLPVKPQLVFVDGRDRIDAGCDCKAVISGDAIMASIAAASIVAKVTRDRLMTRLGLLYPGYGFEHHKGYSVPEHFEALARLGPTIHHRRSFAPVAAAYGDVVTDDMETGEIEPSVLPL